MGRDGANPGFIDDPWRPSDPCLTAVFGQDSLLLGSGDWGDNGYLAIGPRKQEKLPKDHFIGGDKDQRFKNERIEGVGMLLVFPKPEDARDVGRMLMTLAENMEKAAKARSMEDATREQTDGT